MGFWGWRRLMAVFMSVWVVGCSITHDAAPTLPPTQLPKVTLTAHIPISSTAQPTPELSFILPEMVTSTPVVYTVQSGDTLLQIAVRYGIDPALLQIANGGMEPRSLQIGQQLTIPHPIFDGHGQPVLPTTTPLALNISPPDCYSTPTDHILCLGQVTNPLEQAIERVTLLVRLLRPDGSLLIEGEAGIEQNIIPPGATAPYRLLLKADWSAYAGAAVLLRTADSADDAEIRFIHLDIEQQQRLLDDGRYAISAILHNGDSEPAQLYRAIVTLNDAQGQITGYRVVQLNHILSSDESLPLEIVVMPQIDSADTQHTLYIEAERSLPISP